jgi:hypothetical protein
VKGGRRDQLTVALLWVNPAAGQLKGCVATPKAYQQYEAGSSDCIYTCLTPRKGLRVLGGTEGTFLARHSC